MAVIIQQAHRLYPEKPDPGADLASFAVLVPFLDKIEPPTEAALDALERLGVDVYRRPGCSAIDFCRSDMISHAKLQGYRSILFIDSDMLFNPRDALALLRRPEPVVGGAYVQKEYLCSNGKRKVNFKLRNPAKQDECIQAVEERETKTETVSVLGPREVGYLGEGGDYEAIGIGAGFLRIRIEALDTVIDRLEVPAITGHGGHVWPVFLPLVVQEDDGRWHQLGEDYAFCRRCWWAGVPVLLDTRIRLYHLGRFWYGLEEAAFGPPKRYGGLRLPYLEAPVNGAKP